MQAIVQEIMQEIERRDISTSKELNKITAEISNKHKVKTAPKKIQIGRAHV